MIFILIAIACSVMVSINLKLLKRYYTNTYQAIVFNYPAAALLSLLFLEPKLKSLPSTPQWSLFVLIALLLLSIFYFIGKSVQSSGIVLTAIAQRLSLIIPVLASFLVFGEHLNTFKIIGLIVGFAAIYASRPKGKLKSDSLALWYPTIVFAGTGVLDVLFNYLTKLNGLSFTTALFWIFILAAVFGFLSLSWQKEKLQFKAILAGFLLGVFNFGSIYFYIKVLNLESNRPSVVFSALDIGVITLGSLAGLLLFNEKLSKLNKISFFLAIIAIFILTFA